MKRGGSRIPETCCLVNLAKTGVTQSQKLLPIMGKVTPGQMVLGSMRKKLRKP